MTRKMTVIIHFTRDENDQVVMALMEKIAKTAKGHSDRSVTVECGEIGVICAKESK